jgi:hypothetical protein
MGKYVSGIAQGDDSMVGLPVFPSRAGSSTPTCTSRRASG